MVAAGGLEGLPLGVLRVDSYLAEGPLSSRGVIFPGEPGNMTRVKIT